MKMLIEVEEIAYGRVFRTLDGMDGVVSITPIGDGPKSSRQNVAGATAVQKKGGAQSAPCLVLGALMITPGLSRAQLTEVIVSNGKSKNSLPDTIAKLKDAGEIRASGEGRAITYRITAAGKKRWNTACQIQSPEGVS
jgi:hypothetical protein